MRRRFRTDRSFNFEIGVATHTHTRQRSTKSFFDNQRGPNRSGIPITKADASPPRPPTASLPKLGRIHEHTHLYHCSRKTSFPGASVSWVLAVWVHVAARHMKHVRAQVAVASRGCPCLNRDLDVPGTEQTDGTRGEPSRRNSASCRCLHRSLTTHWTITVLQ